MTLFPSVYSLPHSFHPSNDRPSPTLLEQANVEALLKQIIETTAPIDPALEAETAIGQPDSSSDSAITELKSADLRRAEHSQYLAYNLFDLPGRAVHGDASRPWLIYWVAHSLDLLGTGLGDDVKKRAVSTLVHFLHPSGGFAGGPANSQAPHLLPTYASTLSLAICGDAGLEGGWCQLADRRQETYDLFMCLKQPDGGFIVCKGGELDVRGTYCLLVVATLLDILTPELLRNVDKYIASCQTYEGGFACASYSSGSSPFRASPEAHGGYTSCCLNVHFLLESLVPPGGSSSLGFEFPRPIDVDGALRWSVQMQGEAIEGGGFRGRSNKLVDGCYSWWVGGGFPVLEELDRRRRSKRSGKEEKPAGPLLNYVALQEYTLVAAQKEEGKGGGLRDKPGKPTDSYHTCNNLSGLSVAQHHLVNSPEAVAAHRGKFDPVKGLPAVKPTRPDGGWGSEDERQAVRQQAWATALGWVVQDDLVLGGPDNAVNATTPVFNILLTRLRPFISYFYGQTE